MRLFIQRDVAEAFTIQLVNLEDGESFVYRLIHKLDPDADRKMVIQDLARLQPELKALIDQCGTCRAGAYGADQEVLDGVSYELRCDHKVLAMYSPTLARTSSIAALGRCLEAFFEKLAKV